MKQKTLIVKARIFDGKREELLEGMNLLVEGNKITKISKELIVSNDAAVIDAEGKVLMPGMFDAHAHISICAGLHDLERMQWDELALTMSIVAKEMLMRGFTTVRDAGGPVFGIKKMIDKGLLPGPRIYPSGAFVTQTTGHGDFRTNTNRHPRNGGHIDSNLQRLGFFELADGVPQCLAAVREQLRFGATQIKLMAGGGIASDYDPMDAVQYTPEEVKAIVNAAENWNTYVLAHIYNPRSIKQALDAGVMSFEHAHLIDEDSAKEIAEKGAWICPQYSATEFLDKYELFDEIHKEKGRIAQQGFEKMHLYIKKYNINVAFGMDFVGPPELQKLQSTEFRARRKYFSDFEVLKQATSQTAELLALCGSRNPYKEGPLGVIEEGAYADFLIVNGNPLEDVTILEDYENNLLLIMKDGVIHKNII